MLFAGQIPASLEKHRHFTSYRCHLNSVNRVKHSPKSTEVHSPNKPDGVSLNEFPNAARSCTRTDLNYLPCDPPTCSTPVGIRFRRPMESVRTSASHRREALLCAVPVDPTWKNLPKQPPGLAESVQGVQSVLSSVWCFRRCQVLHFKPWASLGCRPRGDADAE